MLITAMRRHAPFSQHKPLYLKSTRTPLCHRAERRGEIIVVSGEHIRYNPALAAKEEAPPGERHLKGGWVGGLW